MTRWALSRPNPPFAQVNKAIENRATINLMLMRWEDAPRTVLVVEKSDKHMREGGIDGARLSNRAVVALEGLCRHCHEALHLNVVVEVRAPHTMQIRPCACNMEPASAAAAAAAAAAVELRSQPIVASRRGRPKCPAL